MWKKLLCKMFGHKLKPIIKTGNRVDAIIYYRKCERCNICIFDGIEYLSDEAQISEMTFKID
jgi:hypothetical protein